MAGAADLATMHKDERTSVPSLLYGCGYLSRYPTLPTGTRTRDVVYNDTKCNSARRSATTLDLGSMWMSQDPNRLPPPDLSVLGSQRSFTLEPT
jgi:hypothetical protein